MDSHAHTLVHSALCRESRCPCTWSRAHPLGACGVSCSPQPHLGPCLPLCLPHTQPRPGTQRAAAECRGTMLKGLGAHPNSTPPPATLLGSRERVDMGLCPQALPLPQDRGAEPLRLDQGRGPPAAVQRKAVVPIPSEAGAPRGSPSSSCVHTHQGPHPLLPASSSIGCTGWDPGWGPTSTPPQALAGGEPISLSLLTWPDPCRAEGAVGVSQVDPGSELCWVSVPTTRGPAPGTVKPE